MSGVVEKSLNISEIARDSQASLGMTDCENKNREENKFSSRVEVWGCDSERFFEVVNQATGLNASFFSSLFFLLLSFFS